MVRGNVARRWFVTLATASPFVLALTLLVAPLAAGAQPAAAVSRIGFLANTPPSKQDPAVRRLNAAFVQGLRENGRVDGQNTIIEWRYADGLFERYPELAAELVRLKVDVIVTIAAPAARAAKQATKTIPIVALALSDPVGQGLITSLARPAGNITGSATLFPELAAKRLELLKEALPRISRAAVLRNVANPGSAFLWKEVQSAGQTLGVTLHPGEVRGPDDFHSAFAAMIKERPEALLMLDDPLLFQYRRSIVDFAAKHRLPAMHTFRESVEAGGLMAYSIDLAELYRRGAMIVDKILKGAKPADLPVEQPTKFELVINLKTAKALGLTIPQSVLARADHVIE